MKSIQPVDGEKFRLSFGRWSEICENDDQIKQFPMRADLWLTQAIREIAEEEKEVKFEFTFAYHIRMWRLLNFAREHEERLRFLGLIKFDGPFKLYANQLFHIFAVMKIPTRGKLSFKAFLKALKTYDDQQGVHRTLPGQ